MESQVVTYAVDDETVVKFEIEPVEGFAPAGADQILGRMQEAIEPALAAARVVLDKVANAPRRGASQVCIEGVWVGELAGCQGVGGGKLRDHSQVAARLG